MPAIRGTIGNMSTAPVRLSHDERLSPATLDVVREIVKHTETKLTSLQTERNRIIRRIHALRYLAHMRAQQESSQNDAALNFKPLLTVVKSKKQQSGQVDNQPPSGHTRQASSKLRRACRIALMEGNLAETSQEIFERIIKRASFSFESYSDPINAISHELRKMASDGEILGFNTKQVQRWEWKRE